MPDYKKLRDMISHRVTLEYDTGAKVIGYLASCGGGAGLAGIGETLWSRGKSFGRQPTVTIAGRPARVWSRTGDGGLLVRVPPGAAAGQGAVEVKQEYGTAQAPLSVRRYAAV